MNKTRFAQWIVLVCIGTLAACTSDEGGTVGNTELNVIVPNGADPSPLPTPDGNNGSTAPALHDIGTVEYTIHCLGNQQPPGGFLDNGATIPDNEVTISGNLEVVDGRAAPPGSTLANSEIWQGFMDLPPGPCSVQLRARDADGEVICTATEPFNIAVDTTTKVDIVLICDISFQAPVGMLDVDGTFSFNVANFCPDLFVLNCVESNPQVPLPGIPPTTYCETRWRDGDSSCGGDGSTSGSACDPQVCVTTAAGLDCAPLPSAVDPAVSTTVTCDAAGLIDCEGDFSFDGSCTWTGDQEGTIGAGIPVPALLGGPGPNPGGFFVACNPGAPPGSVVTCTAITTDGDTDCNKTKQVSFTCPGLNFCDQVAAGDNLTDCDDGNECTTDSCDRTAQACVNTNVPAGGGNNCTTSGGGPGECDGSGVCGTFGCTTDAQCDNPNTPCMTNPVGACDTNTGLCAAEVPGNDGASCASGTGSGSGSCSAGTCVSNDTCAGAGDCDDSNECTSNVCTGVPLVCSNPNSPPGTSCNSGAGVCDGSGVCELPFVLNDNAAQTTTWESNVYTCDVGVFDPTEYSFVCTTPRSPATLWPQPNATANGFCSGTANGCPYLGCEVPSSTLAGQLSVWVDLSMTASSSGGLLTTNYDVTALNGALGIAAGIANLIDITVYTDITSGSPAQVVNVLGAAFQNTPLGIYIVAGTTLVLDNEIPPVSTPVIPSTAPSMNVNFSGDFLLELFLTTAMAPLDVDSSACNFDVTTTGVNLSTTDPN